MKNIALGLVALLPLLSLSAACAAPTTDEDGREGSVSSAVITNGGNIPCHFTTAGCAGEGPDGFSQDPANGGGGGGGGGYAVPPADPGGARAFSRCANQCASQSPYLSQSFGACQLACSATGARFVHHLPGVGFVGDGTPPDPSNYGTCSAGCAGLESSCVSACAGDGVF
jgi:hypothetical protein